VRRELGTEENQRSAANLLIHKEALTWHGQLTTPHGVAWLEQSAYFASMHTALCNLFAPCDFPIDCAEPELRWRRDFLGKPYVAWSGTVADWAVAHSLNAAHLHISNTNDGGAHLVLAAHDPLLIGVGVDVVYLPRLRQSGKNTDYLHRFARKFMSDVELESYLAASVNDDPEALCLRTAAHFSLMEAASKAFGTGLKIGGGMGSPASLPKQALGTLSVLPAVELLVEGEAIARREELGAGRTEAYWSADEEFLVSAVLLWRKE